MSGHPDWLPELHDLLDRLQDGGFTESDRLRINELLQAGAPQRQYFITYMDVHSRLAWEGGRETRNGGEGLGTSVPSEVELPHQTDAVGPEPLIPPIIIDTSMPGPAPLLSTLFAPGGFLFSYGVSAVLLGIALLITWELPVSTHQEVVEAGPRPAAGNVEPPPEIVGRITGVADCRWSDPRTAPPCNTVPVFLGGKYALASGLMEISYETGAKVILQGPCNYEVESPRSGLLSLGKLTARVEKNDEGGMMNDELKTPIQTFIIHHSSLIICSPSALPPPL